MSIDQLASRSLPEPSARLTAEESAALLSLLPSQWQLRNDSLTRVFALPDYATGVGLVVDIGGLADAMNHHPDLHLRWGTLTVSISTHDVAGISELDFILAARIELAATAADALRVQT
jgi:4a-hydroxytetrahydrobiopterin dehydratase